MSDTSGRCIFSGMQILFEHAWVKDYAVVVEMGKIKSIIPAEMIADHLPARRYEFSADHYLIPGLIDMHIHGAKGHDVMDGTETALTKISQALAEEGVTGFLATTMTADDEKIASVLSIMPAAMQAKGGAAILGVHLEGPFLAPLKMGAQNGEHIKAPDLTLMRHWQKLAQGAIKVVTVAPEIPEALTLIKLLHDMDVVASIGHTNATYAETEAAITAGCTQATHLFNAMRGIHQREPGAITALLLAHSVSVELIVDGLHLHPAITELVLRLKGKDRLLLVTDAMRAKCLGDGKYDLGGQSVEVHQQKAALADGTLAGSVLRMPEAIKNMVKFSHCSLIDAIAMASLNPARILGLDEKKGIIDAGKDADLVVLNASLDVMMTMREGAVVFIH